MLRLNLQLFATTDYLKNLGKAPGSVSTTGASNNVKSINGVDQSVVDKINSTYSASSNVTNAQTEANSYLDKVQDMASQKDIVNQSTWDKLNSQFTASNAYQEAMNYTNKLLEQLSSGKTSYTDQIKDLMGQIQNRDKFEYDVDSDPLFQQALSSAMSSGKTAMQDTIGQASALTGGYGSTYATSAANQAYNAYIEDAYNNLPEYYQLAMEAYQMEGQEMYNQLSALSAADATEYQRMYESWNANFANTQQMYNQEYSAWQDSINNAYNSANLQLSEHGQLAEQVYNAYTATQSNAEMLYAQEYQKWADEVANAMNYANMQNTDWWNQTNYDESVRQFNENLAWDKESFAQQMDYNYSSLAQDQSQFEASLAQDQSQFEASLAQSNAQFAQEMAYKNSALAQDQAQFEASFKTKSSGSDTQDVDELSNSEIEALKKVYINAGGGESGHTAVDSQLSAMGKYNVDAAALMSILNGTEVPIYNQNWKITKDTTNWFGGKDNNDVYSNGSTTMTYKELKKEIEAYELSDSEKDAFLNKLKKQSKK